MTGSAEGGEFAAAPPAGRGAWTEPGTFEVAPGVHRIPLPLPNDALRAVNVYAVDGDGGLVLIDSGWALAEARTQLAGALGALGAALGDVSRFLITHVHRDHYTQAVMLRREFGSRISLGIGERPSLELYMSGRVGGLAPQVSRLRAYGAGRVADLFTAWTAARPRPSTAWELPDDWIAAGEVAQLLTWTRRDRAVDELDPYNQMLAVLETAAHLDLLVMQGRLSSTQDGDVTKYWAP